MLIHETLAQRGYSAAASDNGSDNGGTGKEKDDEVLDRGDDFVPTEDDVSDDDKGKEDDKAKAGEEEDGEDNSKAKGKEDDKSKAKDDEGKGKEDDYKKKTEPKIPKSRFDEAVGKERKGREAAQEALKEANEKLAALTKAEGTPEKIDDEIEALETELDKAVADNDQAKVKDLRKQIRGKYDAKADIRAAKHAKAASASAVERVRYDALVATLEKDHPVINPDSDEFDEELAGEVIELKEAFEAKGLGSAQALQKAAKLILANRPPPKNDKGDDDEAAKKIKAAEDAAAKRKEEAIKKGTEASGKQPSDMKDTGKDSDKKGGGFEGNVAKLSEDEFDKLPEDTKKRLRGDFV